MSFHRRALKAILPLPLRTALMEWRRRIIFDRAMEEFLGAVRGRSTSDRKMLGNLIRGWGNEDWSAQEEYLVACMDEVGRTEGAVLECGSGLSTLLIGAMAQQKGVPHHVLEHTPEWAERVQKALVRYRIGASTIHTVPLVNCGAYDWYGVSPDALPDAIGLVICDGPPGDTLGGRYGLMPRVGTKLRPGCVVLLDDGGRSAEAEIAARWQSESGATGALHGEAKPYIRLVVP